MDKSEQDKSEQDKSEQDKSEQDKSEQDKSEQDKSEQDKSEQDKSEQDKSYTDQKLIKPIFSNSKKANQSDNNMFTYRRTSRLSLGRKVEEADAGTHPITQPQSRPADRTSRSL